MPEQNIERIPTPAPEQPSKNESASERRFERSSEVAAPRPSQRLPVRQLPSVAPAAKSVSAAKSETLARVEHVMEERLEDVFRQMPPDVRLEFKRKGEETATQIEAMLYQVKVQSKKIFQLLLDWLRIIPGVNKYFLDQEAKLKTDELLRVKQEMDRERGGAALM